MIEKQLAHCAIKRLKSLPIGTKCTRIELLFPEYDHAKKRLLNYPFRTLGYIFANKSRMFDFFEKKLIKEGYIEDGVYDHVIGYAPPFIYRKKDVLLKKFTEFEEKERMSIDGKTIYYVTTIYEDRNGIQQPLLLYRIPGKSSTGKVPFTCLWVFAMALNGKCVTISSIGYRHSEEGDSPEWEYDENEEIIFENEFFYSDNAKDSWFEIKNNESKDLLVLVEPMTEELVDYDDSDL